MSNKEEWSIEEIVTLLNDTARTDKDNLIDLDGPTGSGKSTLGLKMCIKGCPWFDMQKDILYSRQEIIEWATTARPGSWGLADEAVNALFKRDFATKSQKFLLKIFDMCRDRNLTLIFCIPNFWSLDKHMLEGRIRLRIHVAKTGLAFMWKPSGNPFTPDKWCRKYNEEVCRNWDFYPNAKRTKGFIGFIRFGDLAEKYKSEYLVIKAKKKQMIKELEEREEKEGDVARRRSVEMGKSMMIIWLRNNGLLIRGWETMLAEAEGITKQAVGQKVKLFEEKYGDLIANKVNDINSNSVYKYMDNNDNFVENETGLQGSAE